MNLKELAVEHPYHSSDSNFFSNEAGSDWGTMTDFLDGFEECDVDMNLVFRWDIHPNLDDDEKETGKYSAEVFIIHQRKGIYSPNMVRSITEAEVDRFVAYLKPHIEKLADIWKPLTAL